MGRTKPTSLAPYPRHRPCVKGALRRGCHGETPEKRSSDTKCSVSIECETRVSRENHRNESEQASPFIYLTDSRSERFKVTPTHRLGETAAAAVFEWARPLRTSSDMSCRRTETAPCQFFAHLYPCLPLLPVGHIGCDVYPPAPFNASQRLAGQTQISGKNCGLRLSHS